MLALGVTGSHWPCHKDMVQTHRLKSGWDLNEKDQEYNESLDPRDFLDFIKEHLDHDGLITHRDYGSLISQLRL